MNYKIVKQLKDAGFPQNGMGRFIDGKATMEGFNNNYEKIYEPTLSELIEACKFFTMYFSLEQHSNDWRAGIYSGKKRFSSGSTPDEAVANFWLESKINK